MVYNHLRLLSLPEYERIVVHLGELRLELLEDALKCRSMEEKDYIRGKVEMIDYLMELPKRLFKDEVGKYYGEKEEERA